ncbi:MAG TPA: histidine phosphatase family protein [Aliidongia sp.]|nr:histidine phosphatase family protein [Aliidongia sp.]
MKILTILRHAKAVEASSDLDDHERPLRERGLRQGVQVGQDTAGALPDLVLCSTALRTRETFASLVRGWRTTPPVRYERGLYLAGATALRRQIELAPDSLERIWLIGHNPGVHDLARQLAEHAAGRQKFPSLAAHFPTAARAVFAIDAPSWFDFERSPITFLDFVTTQGE